MTISRVKSNLVANVIGKVFVAVLSFVFVPVYIRFIGVEAYGLVGFFAVLLSVFSLFDMGLSTVFTRQIAEFSVKNNDTSEIWDFLRTFEIVYWAIAICIGAAACLLASFIAGHWIKAVSLSIDTVRWAVTIMGCMLVVRFPTALYIGGLTGLQYQVTVNVVGVAIAFLRGFGAILVLWLVSPTIQAFFIWQIVISGMETLLYAWCLYGKMPFIDRQPCFRKALLMGSKGFAAHLAGISIIGAVLTQADKLVLSKVFSLEMFGYYSLAVVVSNMPKYLISPVFTAMFPRFSQFVSMGIGGEEMLKDVYHKSCQVMSVIIFPPTVLMMFFSREILVLWTHDPLIAQTIGLVVSIMVAGTTLNGLLFLPYALQLAHRWTRLSFYLNLAGVVIFVPLIYYMAVSYGMIGAALGWLMLNCGWVVIQVHLMHKRLLKSEKWNWYFVDIGIPLISSVIVIWVWRLCSPGKLSPGVSFLMLAGALLSGFVITTLVTPETCKLVVQLFKNFFKNRKDVAYA